MNVNEKLSAYINDNGIKQSYLVSKTGMTADSISRILRSTRKITADEFLKVCFALEADPRMFAPDIDHKEV